jgi:hypothetical protein
MGINNLITNFNKLNIINNNDYDADDEMNIPRTLKKKLKFTKKVKKIKNKKLQQLINHMLIVSLNPV